MVIAKEGANKKQLRSLEKLSTETNIENKIAGIIALFKILKVQEKCQKLIRDFYKKAEYHLYEIDVNYAKSGLWALTKQLQKRSY